MIDTITVPLDEFDLPGFIDAYRDFYRSWAGDDLDPDASVIGAEAVRRRANAGVRGP